MFNASRLWADIQAIRESKPLILNITNHVVTNTTANALLAIGASPIMSFAREEVKDLIDISHALVINAGTLNKTDVETMTTAWFAANKKNIPVVFDPVGVGASSYRTNMALTLLSRHQPTIIRGNASEILTLAGKMGHSKGVDSTQPSSSAIHGAKALSQVYDAAVCASGKSDIVSEGSTVHSVNGGHEIMPYVTGLGCTSTAICAAFSAINEDAAMATVHAMTTVSIAGAMAAEKAEGPGTLQLYFYDALYAMTEKDVESRFDVAPA